MGLLRVKVICCASSALFLSTLAVVHLPKGSCRHAKLLLRPAQGTALVVHFTSLVVWSQF